MHIWVVEVDVKGLSATIPASDSLAILKSATDPCQVWQLGLGFEEIAKRTLFWLVLVIAAVLPTAAKPHPIPLEKNTDPAKCVECHEEKTKGKAVHPAVQMGCLSCHFVRGSGDGTRIVLKNGRPSTLCFSCHDDKKVSKAKSTSHVHPPAESDCLKCHDPHASSNEKLLLKPVSGSKDTNLCLSCHQQGVDIAKDGSRHAALDMGCGTCHATHKVGERGKQEFDFHLTKSTPALCIDCHDTKDASLQKAHQNQPVAKADCIECHDPHQSKSPKLMQAYLHNPFESKSCDACHQSAKDGKVLLTADSAKVLCTTCHEEQAKKIQAAKITHPGAAGDCSDCHSPHAGKSVRFLKPNPVQACLSCHADQAEMLSKKPALHDPAFNQKCSICHEAHGGTREKLLKADVDDLCLSCHAPDAKALKATDGKSESVLAKAIILPAGYVATAKHIDLASNRTGHPVPAHPVTNVTDPRDRSKKITCVSCHNPHAGQTKKMLVSSDGTVRVLCGECHQNMKPGPVERYKGPQQ